MYASEHPMEQSHPSIEPVSQQPAEQPPKPVEQPQKQVEQLQKQIEQSQKPAVEQPQQTKHDTKQREIVSCVYVNLILLTHVHMHPMTV